MMIGRKLALSSAFALAVVTPTAHADPSPKCFEMPNDPMGDASDGCIKSGDTTDPSRPGSGYPYPHGGYGRSASADSDDTGLERLAADALASAAPETR